METNEGNSTEFWWGKWPRCDIEAVNSVRTGHVCDLRARSTKHHACTQWACSEARSTKQGLETETREVSLRRRTWGQAGQGKHTSPLTWEAAETRDIFEVVSWLGIN